MNKLTDNLPSSSKDLEKFHLILFGRPRQCSKGRENKLGKKRDNTTFVQIVDSKRWVKIYELSVRRKMNADHMHKNDGFPEH